MAERPRRREARRRRHPIRSEEPLMRRVLICAAVVAATWAAPLGLRTPLAQTVAAAAPNSVARVIVKFRQTSALLLQAGAFGQRPAHCAGGGARSAHRHCARRGARPERSIACRHRPRAQLAAAGGADRRRKRCRIRGRRREEAHRLGAERHALCVGSGRRCDERRPGRRPVVPEATRRRRRRQQHRARGDQRAGGLGHHHRQHECRRRRARHRASLRSPGPAGRQRPAGLRHDQQ